MTSPMTAIQKACEAGRLSGSWLVTGGYGVGKKEFANDVCAYLLGDSFRQNNGFHPDVKWIECGLTEESKKEIQKAILAGKVVDETILSRPRKREITVDDIREGIQFLSLKSGANGWRILIVNPADDMNENAANALLKVLEEPMDNSLILLLCQNTGKLLPTIRSRCRQVTVQPLSQSEMIERLRQLYPSVEDTETVAALAKGSLGLARDIYDNDGLRLYRELTSLLVSSRALSIEKVQTFATDVAKSPEGFDLVRYFLFDWLYTQIRYNATVAPLIAENWLDVYQETESLFTDIDRIYLDKKQVLLQSIIKIAEVLG